MPISKPVIGTMTILKAMWSWNQYQWPLIVSTDMRMKTIQVALTLFQGQNFSEWGYLCAGMTLAILPMFIVFLLAQKQFVGGLTAGAVKG
jgi:ABC-type glycerol-3-phosphate transport system permease component